MAAVVLPLPGPVLTMMSPRRMSAMPGRLILLESVASGAGTKSKRADRIETETGCPVLDTPVRKGTQALVCRLGLSYQFNNLDCLPHGTALALEWAGNSPGQGVGGKNRRRRKKEVRNKTRGTAVFSV